jgi:hypothetical protein
MERQIKRALKLVALMLTVMFFSGCVAMLADGPIVYESPAQQEESSQADRSLYRPFTPNPDPASGSGDISCDSW